MVSGVVTLAVPMFSNSTGPLALDISPCHLLSTLTFNVILTNVGCTKTLLTPLLNLSTLTMNITFDTCSFNVASIVLVWDAWLQHVAPLQSTSIRYILMGNHGNMPRWVAAITDAIEISESILYPRLLQNGMNIIRFTKSPDGMPVTLPPDFL